MSRYSPQERRWVMQLVARLTPAQRAEYERRCRTAPRDHRTGKLYDGAKAQIAEQILLEGTRTWGGGNP